MELKKSAGGYLVSAFQFKQSPLLLNTILYVFYLYITFILEINKTLKFKKGVGIAIKSKETSSKLAI